MKKIFIVFIVTFMLIILSGCNNSQTNNITQNNYTKLSSNTNQEVKNQESQNTEIKNVIAEQPQKQEIEISNYTSKVLDKSKGRVNNLQLACKILNTQVIPSGGVFSFNSVVGTTSKEKGYQKAKIYDSHGKVLEDYGGRNMPNK